MPNCMICNSSTDTRIYPGPDGKQDACFCEPCFKPLPYTPLTLAAKWAKKRVFDDFTFTQDDWFLHPKAVERLNVVGRPPKVDCLVSINNIIESRINTANNIYLFLEGLTSINYPKDFSESLVHPARLIHPWANIQSDLKPIGSNCTCKQCGGPAYMGLLSIKCLNDCK